MSNDLTLIETPVLNEILEKAFAYEILSSDNEPLYEINWSELNKEIEVKKRNFLSKYVNISMDFNEDIINKLEERGYD